jgi:hypothetical protein
MDLIQQEIQWEESARCELFTIPVSEFPEFYRQLQRRRRIDSKLNMELEEIARRSFRSRNDPPEHIQLRFFYKLQEEHGYLYHFIHKIDMWRGQLHDR